MKRSQSQWLAFSFVAVIILIAMSVLVPHVVSRPSEPDLPSSLTPVIKGGLDISIKMIGELDAARTHVVNSTIKGDKGKIIYLVEDGAVIEKDEVLVRLDPTPFETQVHLLSGELRGLEAAREAAQLMLEWEKNQMQREIQNAEFDFQMAVAELSRLVDGEGPLQLAQYRNDLDSAKEEYERYQAYISDLAQLNQQRIDNAAELDRAQRKVEQLSDLLKNAQQRYNSYKDHVLPSAVKAAQVRLEKAKTEIDQIKKAAPLKIGRAAANLEEINGKLETAQASLEQALMELEKTTIMAPFSGIAVLYELFRDGQKRKPRIGDMVWQNQPLLYLPEIRTMIVKTRIREVDLHKIALGQPCAVSVDAFPNQTMDGRVTKLGMLATERFENGFGEKYFQLIVTLDGTNHQLRPGMTARVSVNNPKTEDVLCIPIHALFSDGEDVFCYLAQNGGLFCKKVVQTGRYNDDSVEIIQGLEQGDLISVIQPGPEKIISSNIIKND